MTRPLLLVWLLAAFHTSSFAQTDSLQNVEAILSDIDAILKPARAQRVELSKAKDRWRGAFCEEKREPGSEHRSFICSATLPIGTWAIENVVDRSHRTVEIHLDVRRFKSPENATAVKTEALQRYGGDKSATLDDGALGWCNLDTLWTKDLFFALFYPCGARLSHAKPVDAVWDYLLKIAEPFENSGIKGIASTDGGWSHLLDKSGKRSRAVPSEIRFKRFVRIHRGRTTEVPWYPQAPALRLLNPKIEKLPHDAMCMGVGYESSMLKDEPDAERVTWLRVNWSGHDGWVDGALVTEQTSTECVPPSTRPTQLKH